MKARITKKQFNELYQKSQSTTFLDDKPKYGDPEYLLAYEFFKTTQFALDARERIRVFESIKKNIELIDNENDT